MFRGIRTESHSGYIPQLLIMECREDISEFVPINMILLTIMPEKQPAECHSWEIKLDI